MAIVDPPYGILNKTKRGGDRKFNMKEYAQWDVKPNDEYFNELFRVSKKQIICLDGDGSILMHLGSLRTFGSAFSLIVKLQLVCSEVKQKIPE